MEALYREDLFTAFQTGGLARGDSVIAHGSLRSLGHVERGADTVLDALLEAIGPSGNLMLPTYNYSCPLPEPYFDAVRTPARTGIIPELGRKRSGAIRSLHPTHSVAVIGPDADSLTRNHLAGRAFGVGSPIDRLAQRGGKVLLVGVGHVSNIMIHVAEEHAGVPKPRWSDEPRSAKVRLPDGAIVAHVLDTSPSCSAGFGAAEHALRRHGAIRDVRLGNCL